MTKRTPDLCLVAEIGTGPDWLAAVGCALDATGAVTLVLEASGAAVDAALAKPLVALAQNRKVAALIANDVAAARAAGADGVHLDWRPEIEDAYAAARETLGADMIVGADAGFSRHDAMTLGEAGADYVAFGAGAAADTGVDAAEARDDLVAWWADVFLIPVVVFDVETPEEVAGLARIGADFIAVRLPRTLAGDAEVKAWAAPLRAALTAPADAA